MRSGEDIEIKKRNMCFNVIGLQYTVDIAQVLLILIALSVLIYFRENLKQFRISSIETLGVKVLLERNGQNLQNELVYGSNHFKKYSNGLIIQEFELMVRSNVDKLQITYPITFPSQLMSIQFVGLENVWVVDATLGNCLIKMRPSNNERALRLIISGI